MKTFLLRSAGLATVSALAIVSPAEAHVATGGGSGFVQGFAHPLSGLDHELAMVAVGIWASQVGGRAVWTLPLAFPLAMLLGAVAGYFGLASPLVELGIAFSVIVLGGCIAFALRPSMAIAGSIIGLFAILHGHAHGVELPASANPLLYGVGFLVATLALHLIGILGGSLTTRLAAPRAVRLGGLAIAAVGVFLL